MDLDAAIATGDLASAGAASTRRFAMQWDRRDDLDAPYDFGWIGEDTAGIWLTCHPRLALAQAPRLWGVWSAWVNGLREAGARVSDHEVLSGFELDAHRVLQSAHAREIRRTVRSDDGP
jgi:hypothetical protein